MAKLPEHRVARLEKLLGSDDSHRRVYSHAQLVAQANGLEVGPPELVIGKHELSPAEIVLEVRGGTVPLEIPGVTQEVKA